MLIELSITRSVFLSTGVLKLTDARCANFRTSVFCCEAAPMWKDTTEVRIATRAVMTKAKAVMVVPFKE